MGISTKKILIAVLSLILLFAISCGDRPTGSTTGGGLDSIPDASGQDANVVDCDFSGPLTCTEASGCTKEDAAMMINDSGGDFQLRIENNKVIASPLMIGSGKQLLCPDSSKPNFVVASEKITHEDGSEQKATIEITLDDANNPTTATVVYYFGVSYSSSGPTITSKHEGTLNKTTGN